MLLLHSLPINFISKLSLNFHCISSAALYCLCRVFQLVFFVSEVYVKKKKSPYLQIYVLFSWIFFFDLGLNSSGQSYLLDQSIMAS